jgi:sugar lactone lactonase YvrE
MLPAELTHRRGRKRLRRLLWVVPLIALALAAAGLWITFGRPPTIALDSRWTASALVLAGDGVAGVRDGDAAEARFSDPFGVAVSPDGTVYVADGGDAPRMRRISPDGRVSTVAGGDPGFTDGTGSAARFSTPSGLAVDERGAIYVADTGNNAIRRMTADGHVSTIAGDGVAGYQDGPALHARFNGPVGVAVDANGRVIVADTYNDRIRAIDRDGSVRTLAGSGEPGALDGVGPEARFHTPCGVAVDASGRIHVADTGSGLVRTIAPNGLVTTRAVPVAGLFRPIGIAVNRRGDVVVSDQRGRLVEVAADNATRTLAGWTPGFHDGSASDARFRGPAGLAFAGPARLIVADAGNALVRLVADPSRLESRPPASPRVAPRFDADGFGLQPLLWPVEPLEGPHEIAGTLGEVRGGEGAERFHAGIDVRVDEGTLVHAVRNGIVTSPIATDEFGSLNEWLRIGPVTYVHMRAGRTRRNDVFDPARFVPTYDASGRLILIRVKRGARFTTGDVVGTVNAFNHVHLNVGWSGEERNPLRFRLVQFEDTVAPTIARGGVRLYDEVGRQLTRRDRGRLIVSGRVQVIVDAADQADGNRPQRRLGLYDLGYQVLTPDGSPAAGFDRVRHTQRFDRLAVDPEAAHLVYSRGSGIPFFGRRRTRFLYVVTNTFRDGIAARGFWDTTLLAPGNYTFRVWAADIRGNVAVANRDVPVTIVSSVTAAPPAPPH